MSGINIKQLAHELNLSAASVSRALRDSHEISTSTKEKVLALAKKLNYEPNPFASNLRHPQSKTIAVIIPEINNHFFSLAVNGIEDIARKHDFHVLIYQSHEDSEMEISFTNRMLNGRVEGILISVSNESNNSGHFSDLSKKIPIVFFDRVYENIDVAGVITNDYESSFNATQYLINCGCKRILYCKALNKIAAGQNRLRGYIDALQANGLLPDENLMVNVGNNKLTNKQLIKSHLTSFKPDGILSSVEEMAFPCYMACNELNLRIPEDIKIISFSNLESASLLNPPLTTITQPAFEMGQRAADILFKKLQKKMFETEDQELKSILIKRASTGNY
ncbi:LacI family DNA-binding transcriptional regulator [Mucilaginibacter terrae]|uniref:LacI family DNA-binding transcriptional regulator n=1 Tax=Mucilaginibacter terrae TaxID=1955052 RepID=UPI00362D7FB4